MHLRGLKNGDNLLNRPIMIVGAGPAGISTWLHLQQEDPQLARHSIVIEEAVFPRDKLCAGALCIWVADVLAHLGVDLDTLLSSFDSKFDSDLEIKFGKEVYRFHQDNYFRVVQRADFDHALAKAAVKRGLELHEDEKLIDVLRTQNKLNVITNKGKYAVQVLVGADGAFSTVRKKMLPFQKRHLAPTLQIVSPADSRYGSEFKEKKTVVDLTAINEGLQGYVWHVPCLRGENPSIIHGIVDFQLCPNGPRADMKKIFSHALRSRNIHKGPKTWSSHPIPWHSDEDILSQPNVILVGDAAGIEPAFGGGIHLSLSYGDLAGQSIIEAFQKDDFSFCNYQEKVQSHSVGRFVAKCTRLALEMYGGRVNPLDVARELFDSHYDPSVIMRQLLSRYLELHDQSDPDPK
jgi:flavin-dependent dehydrogenase